MNILHTNRHYLHTQKDFSPVLLKICVFWILSNVAPQTMRAVCVRKVRQLLSKCQNSSLKLNMFIPSSPFSLHTHCICFMSINVMPLMKSPFFSVIFLKTFRSSLNIIDSVTDVTGLKLPKYSLMQDPEVTWSLWQGQRWQEETSQHQHGAQVRQRRPRARRGAQAQAHTHWTHRCPAAAPSRAHSGEATQSTHEHQTRRRRKWTI